MNYELSKYQEKFIPKVIIGLNNTGAICWFNSLLQSLISLSSFNEHMINNKSKNTLCEKFARLIENNENNRILENL